MAVTTTLNGAISDTATSISLTSFKNFPVATPNQAFDILLQSGSNSETIRVLSSISAPTLRVMRGMWGSTAQAWGDGTAVSLRAQAFSVDEQKQDRGDDAHDTAWTTITTTSATAIVNHTYVTNNASLVTIILPATAPLGSFVQVRGLGAGGWKLQAASGQVIHVGQLSSSTTGYMQSAANFNSVTLECIVANTTWTMVSSVSAGFTVA